MPALSLLLFCDRQDVAFFDANKTGQLVNRLTSDIQEFKSSFKLVISQVLILHRILSQEACLSTYRVLLRNNNNTLGLVSLLHVFINHLFGFLK